MQDLFGCLEPFTDAAGRSGAIYAVPRLEASGAGRVSRLPVCLRIVLESLLRHVDGRRVTEDDVRALAAWRPNGERTAEIPFLVGRVLLQDFTGVPLVVDLAAMRSAVERLGQDPGKIQPLVPVDLVVDHSVQVDFARTPDALQRNVEMELRRNEARYAFLQWGRQAFAGMRIVPSGIGICHQVNLELLASVVLEREGLWLHDTVVGTDSHTPMVNGLGVLGWGAGGIEAEAAMLGQPMYFLAPDVVGVRLRGSLRAGVTATDLVLHVTELLREAKVVGKLVEFHGEGAASLGVAERATISNMAPEYGATAGFFPVDEASLRYLRETGRPETLVQTVRRFNEAQGTFGIPRGGEVDYSEVIDLDLGSVGPSVAGPRRPQDRIDLADLKTRFRDVFVRPAPAGFGKPIELLGKRRRHEGAAQEGPAAGGGDQDTEARPPNDARRDTSRATELEMADNRPTPDQVALAAEETSGDGVEVGHGDVLIAAITSCTNTSNPSVMLAAGLLAKKARARGLRVRPCVKTSLAPGSRVVTEYLRRAGLDGPLDELGFHLVGYGCTTCIGNSGPLDPRIEELIARHDLVGVSVLSGNRNFEARVHQSLRANFLMSPPLVVAFAIAGRIDVDLVHEPLGLDHEGEPVLLRDVWPTPAELAEAMRAAQSPEDYRRLYAPEALESEAWARIAAPAGTIYRWDAGSTYVQEPPFFLPFERAPRPRGDLSGARALAIFGDSVTTDHISPAGAIPESSPAGRWLVEHGVPKDEFNSYGARRGNHHVMMRGTFANVRIRNLMVPDVEGGVTLHQPGGERMAIFDAALRYQEESTPLVVIAGLEYGSGSSRDWAAKGPRLLGVEVVVARSFERIHRSNLVFMGILPCQLPEGVSAETLRLDGTETYDVVGMSGGLRPRQEVELLIRRAGGAVARVPLIARVDTPIEADYWRHGGILPYVLRRLTEA